MMQSYYELLVFLLLAVPLACTSQELDDDRHEKLISTFQIVRFPNDPCLGSGGTRNGTCYTSAECSDKGGSSSGSCADGFGVCCTFVINTCDTTSKENITYWTNPTTVAGGNNPSTCGLTLCPVSDDICQIRIDFTNFVITGPSTLTILQVRRKFGQPYGDLTDAYALQASNYATNCQLDHFSVQGASPSSGPPMICGVNTGLHMYVEADVDRCNKMNFNFAGAPDAIAVALRNTRGLAALAARTWDMTLTQIECTSRLLPRPGCTQYFFGPAPSHRLTSYNYNAVAGTGMHLANQHQVFCIRRERGMCTGCFSADVAADFAIGGHNVNAFQHTNVAGCCGYQSVAGAGFAAILAGDGAAATTAFGFDCIIIPGAYGPTAAIVPVVLQTAALIQQSLFLANNAPTPWPPNICGGLAGIGPGTADLDTVADYSDVAGVAIAGNISVCTKLAPFTLEFLSDDLEGMGAVGEFASNTQAKNMGISLKASQLACTQT